MVRMLFTFPEPLAPCRKLSLSVGSYVNSVSPGRLSIAFSRIKVLEDIAIKYAVGEKGGKIIPLKGDCITGKMKSMVTSNE